MSIFQKAAFILALAVIHLGAAAQKISSEKVYQIATVEGALDFSAQHFTDEDIFNAKYCHELPKVRRPETVLCLDRFMEGIGNGSCGPTTLPKYKITPGQEYSYKFRIEAKADGFR